MNLLIDSELVLDSPIIVLHLHLEIHVLHYQLRCETHAPAGLTRISRELLQRTVSWPDPGLTRDRRELKGNVIDLEEHELVVLEVGHSDTDHMTCLNVSSIGLVVAAGVAYNDVHLYLIESNAQTRREWISACE